MEKKESWLRGLAKGFSDRGKGKGTNGGFKRKHEKQRTREIGRERFETAFGERT